MGECILTGPYVQTKFSFLHVQLERQRMFSQFFACLIRIVEGFRQAMSPAASVFDRLIFLSRMQAGVETALM